jgi:peptide/nickel transport system permease protein
LLRYAARRILLAVVMVWAVASSAFVLTRLAPGDASVDPDRPTTADLRAAERSRLGLDRPWPEQYAGWLGGAVRLDFGESSLYARPVGQLVRERAFNTAILAVAALVLAAVLGVPIGVFTATRRGTAAARLAQGVSILLLSTPPLVASLVLVLIAARTGLAPVGGMRSADLSSSWTDLIAHLVVPAFALGLPLAATLERVQSQSMGESLGRPFVVAARARGAEPATVIARHAWPVSVGPVLGFYGLMIGMLFSGSFVVEIVTAWPGLGRLMVDALRARDLFLATGTAAAGAVCLAGGTLVGDLVHAAIDPREREETP